MEKVQKVPIDIKIAGTPDQHGNLAYNVTFSDQMTGFFRCKEQNLFVVGQPAEFMYGEVEGKMGKKYYKIGRVPNPLYEEQNKIEKSEKSSFKGETQKEKNKSFALAYAKDIFCHTWRGDSIPTPIDVYQYAEVFAAWLDGDIKDEQLPPIQDKLRHNETETKDELPF